MDEVLQEVLNFQRVSQACQELGSDLVTRMESGDIPAMDELEQFAALADISVDDVAGALLLCY